MLFRHLQASAALRLESYTDFDHFRESERYAQADSIPLSADNFDVLRASVTLPSATLSLLRTFPRIINGYDFAERLVLVVPMDGVASTRLNGQPVGQSLILIKGRANCTVVEPEGRLVAILSVQPELLDRHGLSIPAGHLLLRLQPAELPRLQALIRSTLQRAAREPEAMAGEVLPCTDQDTLFTAIEEALRSGTPHGTGNAALARYKSIIDQVDRSLGVDPIDTANDKLAEDIGVSVRTLQTASRLVCGLPLHRYSRLRRLCAVRRQLRTGAPGLSVKASALAHGFRHHSEFTNAYQASFGELPSATLMRSRKL